MNLERGDTRPRGAKELPLHISPHHSGYRVMIRRGKMLFRAHAKTIEEAVRLKEQFEAAAGPALYPKTRPSPTVARSNTGVVGITETVKWVRYRPRTCLHVQWQQDGKLRCKRIHFGPRCRTRAEAMRIALKLREAHRR